MSKVIDLTGKKFGRLTAIKYVGTRENYWAWECICECGNKVIVPGVYIRNGSSSSCGCYMREVVSKTQTKHGKSNSTTYTSWRAMKTRCYNKNVKEYRLYGKRGIKVCDRWLESFSCFIEDMGIRPRGTSLERIDVNGNYEPSNCRWATKTEQCNNTRRNKFISYNGGN